MTIRACRRWPCQRSDGRADRRECARLRNPGL